MKQRLGVTLFEDQIARYFLGGNEEDFFVTLAKSFDLVIFTNSKLLDFIESRFDELEIDCEIVIEFKIIPDRGLTRVVGFLLHSMLSSESVLVEQNRKKFPARCVAKFVRTVFGRALLLRNFLRFVHKYSIPQKTFESSFQKAPPPLAFLFVTSLTNNYEDVRVGTYYKRFTQTKLIGTVRSWDNLTSHGSLRLVPDLFLSHSDFMTAKYVKVQQLDQSRLYAWQVPAYRSSLNPREGKRTNIGKSKIKVVYACMGLSTNPDDKNMAEWLISIFSQKASTIDFTILQHPKFLIDIQDSSETVCIKKFDYMHDSLADYYEFLCNQDLVLCGGTSVILDCLFTGTPIILLNFEISKQDFWYSSLRYFDMIEHTRDLFIKYPLPIANSKTGLLSLISELSELKIESLNNVSGFEHFLGNRDVNAGEVLVKAIEIRFNS